MAEIKYYTVEGFLFDKEGGRGASEFLLKNLEIRDSIKDFWKLFSTKKVLRN